MMKVLAVLMIVLGCVGSAGAAGSFGFYFDEAGTVKSVNASVGETVTAYLVVHDGGYSHTAIWWALNGVGVAHFSPSDSLPLSESLPFSVTLLHGGIDIGAGSCWNPLFPGYDGLWCPGVVFSEPIVIDGTAVLAELEIDVLSADDLGIFHHSLYLSMGIDELTSRSYEASTACIRLAGWEDEGGFLSATINSDVEPLATDETTWGSLKALYR